MNAKFELSSVTEVVNGKTLYRVKALCDFSDIKKGELGGFVESLDNLSQEGACWVYDDAKVMDDAYLYEDAIIKDSVCLSERARVHGDCILCGFIKVSGCEEFYGNCFEVISV